MKRENVPALDPRRYGFPFKGELRPEFISETNPSPLVDGEKLDVDGILEFPDVEGGERTIEQIAERLADVYCAGIGYEVSRIICCAKQGRF